MRIEGTVALVTGASRGIGRACATLLHQRGASVGLIARSPGELEALSSHLGDRVACATADVADKGKLDAAVEEIGACLGPPDILVNNAGAGAYASVLEEDSATFERMMRVNYLGTVHGVLAVLPGMADRRRGHIVNVASVAGQLGAPFEAAYSASKFAVVGFSEALAAEVHHLGISVSLINPGPVSTHFTEARGVPFQRKYPRPLPSIRVAQTIVDGIEKGRFEQTLPRWLRIGCVTRSLAPSLYIRGLLRDASKDSRALARRWENRAP